MTFCQVHLVWRHGDRTPISPYPNDPYKDYQWPGGLGQLGHWMALMAEHMTQDPARLQQFLWPKLLTGKYQGYYPRFYVPRVKFKEFYYLLCYIIYLKTKNGGLEGFNIQTVPEWGDFERAGL